MNAEEIIRREANEFYETTILSSLNANAIDDFREIRSRLYDFYTDENKAIFLDHIELRIKDTLKRHRDQSHGGKPSPNCDHEIRSEKLLFYIQQELNTLPVIAHQKFKTADPQKRDKVFVSYCHVDKAFLRDIQRHFKPFSGHINYWDDSRIQPGEKWKEEIRKAISETKVAIFLVSTDFLGSEFIMNEELPSLLSVAEEQGAAVLILILKPCLFDEFEELNQFQAMNPPNKPVIKMDETEREELYVNLVRQTLRILEK